MTDGKKRGTKPPVPPAAKAPRHLCTYCEAHGVGTQAVMGFVVPHKEHGDVLIKLCPKHLADACDELSGALLALATSQRRAAVAMAGVAGPLQA